MPNTFNPALVAVLQMLKRYHLDGFQGLRIGPIKKYAIHIVPDVLLNAELDERLDARLVGEAIDEGILRGLIQEYSPESGQTYRLPNLQCQTLDGRPLSIEHTGDRLSIRAGENEYIWSRPPRWYGLTPRGFEAADMKQEELDAKQLALRGAPAENLPARLPTISNVQAARLYADLTDTKPDTGRIGRLIRKGTLATESDGRTTEGAVARYAQSVRNRRQRRHLPKPATTDYLACPQCQRPAHILVGAAKVCATCFHQNLGLDPDETNGE